MGLSDFFSPGGSNTESKSFSGLDPSALKQWDMLFSGAQQGIAPWQQAAAGQLMKQAGTQFSALDAARGGQNPFTGPQIQSSALQYVLPQFAQLNSQMLDSLMGQRQISNNTSKGIQRGPGIGYNFANELGKNLAQWTNPSTFSPGGGKGFFGGK